MKEAIQICGLAKRYGERQAVFPLDLEIPEGELFGLLGVNGAGKTTLIRMLCGLSKPTAGEAYVGGYSILTQSVKVKECIGISTQETAIAPKLTVRENLQFMARLQGLREQEAVSRTKELSEQFGLDEYEKSFAGTLSGGWQRRLSIAMALVSCPRILFLDEPTLGLDVLARRELWEVIRGLKGRTTVILTTHYLEEAEALSDRIGIMVKGRLIALGSAQELKARAGTDSFEDAFVAFARGEATV